MPGRWHGRSPGRLHPLGPDPGKTRGESAAPSSEMTTTRPASASVKLTGWKAPSSSLTYSLQPDTTAWAKSTVTHSGRLSPGCAVADRPQSPYPEPTRSGVAVASLDAYRACRSSRYVLKAVVVGVCNLPSCQIVELITAARALIPVPPICWLACHDQQVLEAKLLSYFGPGGFVVSVFTESKTTLAEPLALGKSLV